MNLRARMLPHLLMLSRFSLSRTIFGTCWTSRPAAEAQPSRTPTVLRGARGLAVIAAHVAFCVVQAPLAPY